MSYVCVIKFLSMVKAKSELFDEELQTAAEFFKSLGHPARLAILQYLSSTENCIMGDISEELPLSRTTVNQHLKALKDMGVIKGEVEGAKVNYCINTHVIEEIKAITDKFLGSLKCSKQSKCS
jgi:ArsR family transcriptional regulator, arsenate/arsenite/antimonite-responsive transcriptional repressor